MLVLGKMHASYRVPPPIMNEHHRDHGYLVGILLSFSIGPKESRPTGHILEKQLSN